MPPVLAKVDVPGIVNFLQNELDDHLMGFFGGANEAVVGDVQLGPELPEKVADAVGVRLGIFPGGPGGLGHFVPVFIRAGQEKSLVPGQFIEAVEQIRHDGGIGMADMRLGVHVINRRGGINFGHFPFLYFSKNDSSLISFRPTSTSLPSSRATRTFWLMMFCW